MEQQPEPPYVGTWQMAELNAADWMRRWGHHDAHVTGGGADGGIDVHSCTALAQVKFEAAAVGAPAIQRLVGAAILESHKQLFFFSGVGYSQQAITYADQSRVALFHYSQTGAMSPVNGTARLVVNATETQGWRHAPPPTVGHQSLGSLPTPGSPPWPAPFFHPPSPPGLASQLDDMKLAGISKRDRQMAEAAATFPLQDARDWAQQYELQKLARLSASPVRQNWPFALVFVFALNPVITLTDSSNQNSIGSKLATGFVSITIAVLLFYWARSRKRKLVARSLQPLSWRATTENMPRTAKMLILGIKQVHPGRPLTTAQFGAIAKNLPKVVPGLEQATATSLLEGLTGPPQGK